MKVSLSSLSKKVSFVLFLCAQMAFAQFSGGTGSKTDPYKLSSLADLEELSDNVNDGNDYVGKYLRLTQNIDASATGQDDYHNGHGFNPIGKDAARFNGHLNGGGFVVENLKMDKIRYVGLIGYADSASTIDSIGVVVMYLVPVMAMLVV